MGKCLKLGERKNQKIDKSEYKTGCYLHKIAIGSATHGRNKRLFEAFCVTSWQFIHPLVFYVIPTSMFLREQMRKAVLARGDT